MSEPTMRSPLHSFGLSEQAKPIDGSCGVWANELRHLGYISLRGNGADPAFATAASTAIGVSLPLRPCTFASSNGKTILWLSPDEWMIVCPRAQLSALLGSLRQALTDVRSQVVDNSGGYTQVIIEGRNALDVLQHVSVYDFASMEPGRVVGTTFGKSSVYAFRQGNGYRLVLRRSFADYIWRYLVRAAIPYGLGIADLAGSPLPEEGVPI
ncbi:sarcosine oxidase subunit gamma [Hyphomicrobium sp.]|uniref:sarcosine oxidase subunit gamma n=1 Tax=Hyphomicrobium sp. TaxID=82 RepID=UPI001E152C3C|nr:sarcosine oxidase subunit gamma family protein [Hyphomicrobium sp.]MBY0559501.1 sarcosine oxidase subunit gamma [Hyphomicrobium sp.]